MSTDLKRSTVVFALLALLLASCGGLSAGVETPTTEAGPQQTEAPDGGQTPEGQPSPEGQTPTDQPEGARFWVQVEDYRTGVRFAIPCFWRANVPAPEQDPGGLGAFSIQNYDEQYVLSFGDKRGDLIWENGATKIDILYFEPQTWNLSPGVSLEEMARGIYPQDDPAPESWLVATEPVEVNGQEGLLLTTESATFGQSQFYLFNLRPDLFLGFSPRDIDHPDVQAILHSLALSPEASVQLPDIVPADPPVGFEAPCLEASQEPAGEVPASAPLDCTAPVDAASVGWVICNVQDGLTSRNTSALIGYMADPFTIGYWGSEGIQGSPVEMLEQIHNLYNYADPNYTPRLTFTSERAQFPPLEGTPPETIFGPDLNVAQIVYSQGWGEDGQGAALLYFTQESDGGYAWYGMVFSPQDFDR